MQKKIIALAIASALTAPAAFAEVTVYGKADLSIGTTSNGTVTNTQLASNVTKIGFKGAENLGDGLSAVWQIEQQIDINNAGQAGTSATHNTFAGRNSFLGLKGESWGTVLMGRHDTPYKMATRGLDVFGDQFADNRHLMGGGLAANGGSLMDARPGNEVLYFTPNMNGFKATVSYAANTSFATTAAQDKGSIWSLAGIYDQGPFFGAIAYQKLGLSNAPGATFASATAGNSIKAWKIGAGYTMDAFKITGTYEKITSSIGGIDTVGRNNYNLGGIYKFGNDDVKLSYTVAGNTAGTVATGAKMIGVGYDHNFSKATSIYAQYNRIANDAAAAFGFNGAATTATAAGVAGQKTSGFMLGMKHAF